jgi:hypothetical protein
MYHFPAKYFSTVRNIEGGNIKAKHFSFGVYFYDVRENKT